jgi:hypothetical protein
VLTFDSARNAELKSLFYEKLSSYTGSQLDYKQLFSVELIADSVSKMTNFKAAGLDELSCEHIKFSHPLIVSILCGTF